MSRTNGRLEPEVIVNVRLNEKKKTNCLILTSLPPYFKIASAVRRWLCLL